MTPSESSLNFCTNAGEAGAVIDEHAQEHRAERICPRFWVNDEVVWWTVGGVVRVVLGCVLGCVHF